jgi:hypothetical protein
MKFRESNWAIRARKAKSSQFGGAIPHRNYSTKQFSPRWQVSRRLTGGGGPEHPGRRNLVDVSWHEDAFHPAEFSRLTRRNCEFEILIKLFGQIRDRGKLGCRKTIRGCEKLADGDEPECCSPLNFIMAASARPWPCRRALQVRGEPLAAADVASLRVRV